MRGRPKFKRGTYVKLLDHIEVPYNSIGKMGIVDHTSGDGYIGLIVRDEYGRVITGGSARHLRGILVVPVEAVRLLTPLEQLAMTADD